VAIVSWTRPTPQESFVVQETEMHPWTMQRLAEERRHELIRDAARGRAAHEARRVGSGGSTLATRRAGPMNR
jgi:hypothetical protein